MVEGRKLNAPRYGKWVQIHYTPLGKRRGERGIGREKATIYFQAKKNTSWGVLHLSKKHVFLERGVGRS